MLRGLVALLALLAAASVALAEKRVALVIGNADYDNAAPLKNPVNDATDIARVLERLDFDVVLGTDLDHNGLRRTVKTFADKLVGVDVAVFFYAGHAVQVGGQNYLAPIDTSLEKEADLDFETISLELVRRQMEREAKTMIIFLDACRDNPLTRSLAARSRSAGDSKGLARLDASGEGTFIAYATQPDNVALDGEGRNSPFTTALLANIERPGVEISALMTDVRRSVYDTTGGRQLPWTNSSLLGQFFFKDALPSVPDPGQLERDIKLERLELEAQLWESIRNSTDADAIRNALKVLGDGPYAELARTRLASLQTPAGTEPAAQPKSADPVSAGTRPEPESDPVVEKDVEQAAAPEVPPVQQKETVEDKQVQVALAEPAEAGGAPETPELADTEPDRQLVRSIQQELDRVGCDPGGADGLWGRRSRAALGQFSRHGEIDLATLEPTAALLDALKAR
ncbi:MAG: caspase family protein, partial [Pseudomonadota bacterium]|nr:caspase family protein [Pseudomonadota bacterium]